MMMMMMMMSVQLRISMLNWRQENDGNHETNLNEFSLLKAKRIVTFIPETDCLITD